MKLMGLCVKCNKIKEAITRFDTTKPDLAESCRTLACIMEEKNYQACAALLREAANVLDACECGADEIDDDLAEASYYARFGKGTNDE